MNENLLKFEHKPVLSEAVAEALDFHGAKARIIDGTLGNGGHSRILLERNPNLEILGIDRDMDAIERATMNLAFAGDRIKICYGNFSGMAEIAEAHGWNDVDGILLDIGVSSPQLDDAKRGFSWRFAGPLDMRMDRSNPLTASRILNYYSESELADIFFHFGEIKKSRKLARFVVERREIKPFETTEDLVEVCDAALGKSHPGQLPSPTLAFQAIRIAVNDELGELENALHKAFGLLKINGILAVISFHSLEDRMVKQFMRDLSTDCKCPPEFPVCVCHHRAELEILNRKVISANKNELEENRRSGCAKLRLGRRLL